MSTTAGEAGLSRRIGLLPASLSGIGIILGAGVYVLVGEAAGVAGNGLWASFLLAALLATATGLSYAELTSMIPEAGAAAAYTEEAFGPRAGFLAGWMDVSVNSIAAPAVALGFGGYVASLLGGDPLFIAIVLIIVCTGVVLAGIGHTVAIASVIACIEAAGLLVVIAFGVPFLGDVDLLQFEGGAGGLLAAAALVFFAYIGFEEIASLSEEVKNPGRNVPRALLLAIGVTSAIYVGVAAVAVSVVPWDTLAESTAPLADVVSRAAGAGVGDAVAVAALFATFNTVLLVLATAPRVMYGMARRRMLPAVLGKVSRTRRTPWVAILLTMVIALAFVLTGDTGFVAQVTNFAVFVLFIAVNAALIRLRYTQPDRARPFRLPSLGRVPPTAVAGLGAAGLLSVFMDRQAFVVGAAALALGLVVSLLTVGRRA